MPENLPAQLPPGLIRKLVPYALADMFGVFCFGLGASWFLPALAGVSQVLGVGPKTLAEAFAFMAGGVAVMWWAMARLLRAVGRADKSAG